MIISWIWIDMSLLSLGPTNALKSTLSHVLLPQNSFKPLTILSELIRVKFIPLRTQSAMNLPLFCSRICSRRNLHYQVLNHILPHRLVPILDEWKTLWYMVHMLYLTLKKWCYMSWSKRMWWWDHHCLHLDPNISVMSFSQNLYAGLLLYY